MKNSEIQNNEITYSVIGDYFFPDLHLPEQRDFEIGVWGFRRKKFLKENHRVKYYAMLTNFELYPHLEDVEKRADKLFHETVEKIAEQEGVTEQLKNNDMLLWIGKMNNIRNRALEIVNEIIIFEE